MKKDIAEQTKDMNGVLAVDKARDLKTASSLGVKANNTGKAGKETDLFIASLGSVNKMLESQYQQLSSENRITKQMGVQIVNRLCKTCLSTFSTMKKSPRLTEITNFLTECTSTQSYEKLLELLSVSNGDHKYKTFFQGIDQEKRNVVESVKSTLKKFGQQDEKIQLTKDKETKDFKDDLQSGVENQTNSFANRVNELLEKMKSEAKDQVNCVTTINSFCATSLPKFNKMSNTAILADIKKFLTSGSNLKSLKDMINLFDITELETNYSNLFKSMNKDQKNLLGKVKNSIVIREKTQISTKPRSQKSNLDTEEKVTRISHETTKSRK